MTKRYKLAYMVSHPIQYQAPLLRYLTEHSSVDLTAFFLSDFSLGGYYDPGFGRKVEWDVPLVDGYKHVFLKSIGSTKKVTSVKPFSIGLTEHLREGQFDALWVHGYHHMTHLRAIHCARSLGIKTMVRAETHLACAQGSGYKLQLKSFAMRRLFQMIDVFLAVGKLNHDYYVHHGVPIDKIVRMPYTVDNIFFQRMVEASALQQEQIRNDLQLEPNRPIILYASRLIPRKRADDLLEAYIRLSPDGKSEPAPYLLFIGDGEERARLEARVKELNWNSVKFLGFKNQTELPAYYGLCDVFVLVSDREPWALIVNEVMNAAKPVILSNQVGSAHDLVHEGENGYVVPMGDVDALHDRLTRILADPEKSRTMGKKSFEIINEWSFHQNLLGLEQALEKVSARP